MGEASLSRASMLTRPPPSSRRCRIDQTQLIIVHLLHVDRRAVPFERARQTSELLISPAGRRVQRKPGCVSTSIASEASFDAQFSYGGSGVKG